MTDRVQESGPSEATDTPVASAPALAAASGPAATPAPPGRQLGLRAQLILWWSALVVLVLAGTGMFVYQQRRDFLDDQLQQKGRYVVNALARILVDPLLEGNYGQLQNFVREQAEAELVDYAVLEDLEGRVLASAGAIPVDSLESEVYARIARTRTRHEPVFQQPAFLGGRRFLEFSTRVSGPGVPAMGVIRVGLDTELRIDRVVEQGMNRLMLVFLSAVPLGVILSILLAIWIVRPIRVLVEGAEAIAEGDFDRPVVVHSPRELSVLAASFDHMRLRIRAQLQEIRDAYERLDRKVYELEVLYEVAGRMNFKSYSPELLSFLLDTSIEALEASWGSLMMEDPSGDPQEMVVRMVRGAGFDPDDAVRIGKGEGVAGEVYETGVPRISNEGSADPDFVPRQSQSEFEATIENLICVPLMVENQPIGVINVVNKRRPGGFTGDDQNLLVALASHAARSLENAKLYDQAIRESKTGLFVPRYFSARVNEEIVVSRRYGRVFSLLVLDIDHFKRINDTFGHLIGDEVLVKLAGFALSTLRENIDVASRFGGEEFALLLPETDTPGAVHVAERLRQMVETDMEDEDAGLPRITISVGVATWPTDALEPDALFQVADESLYAAKESGRNQVRAGRAKNRFEFYGRSREGA